MMLIKHSNLSELAVILQEKKEQLSKNLRRNEMKICSS